MLLWIQLFCRFDIFQNYKLGIILGNIWRNNKILKIQNKIQIENLHIILEKSSSCYNPA